VYPAGSGCCCSAIHADHARALASRSPVIASSASSTQRPQPTSIHSMSMRGAAKRGSPERPSTSIALAVASVGGTQSAARAGSSCQQTARRRSSATSASLSVRGGSAVGVSVAVVAGVPGLAVVDGCTLGSAA